MAIQWPLALFTLLAGGAGWLLVWTCVNELTGQVKDPLLRYKELLCVAILAVVGGCCSAMHLSHVDRMLGALSHPTSAIFTEAVMVGLVFLLCIVYMVLAYRQAKPTTLKVVAVIGIILGVIISYATGAGYVMSGRPNWNTPLMPICYAATASAFGSMLYLLFVSTWKGGNAKRIWPYSKKPAEGEEEIYVPLTEGVFDAQKDIAVKFASKCAVVTGIIAAILVTIYAVVQNTFSMDGIAIIYVISLIGCLGVIVCGFTMLSQQRGSAVPVVGTVCGVMASLGFRCFMFAAGTGLITLISSPDVVNHFFATI